MQAQIQTVARALPSRKLPNESDWLIFVRTFFFLCYVTKEIFQLQNKSVASDVFLQREKSLLNNSQWEVL